MTIDTTTIDGGESVLLLDPASDSRSGNAACETLLAAEGHDVDQIGELHVVYGSDDRGTSGFGAGLDSGPSPGPGPGPGPGTASDRDPHRLGLISVGDQVRSTAASDGPDFSGAVAVDAIPDPADMRSVGVSISQFLDRWGSLDHVGVCFDSVTELLAHVEPDVAFRFVHLLTNQLESTDVVAHFHLDPTAHDEHVVETFETLFERVERVERVDRVERVEPLDLADRAAKSASPDGGSFKEASDEDVLGSLRDAGAGERSHDRGNPQRPPSTREIDEATDADVADAFDE